MKLALIREWKNPPDKRVALTPLQMQELSLKYPDHSFVVESSPDRIYSDEDYRLNRISVVSDVSDCDILMGVKEVPVDHLNEGKTYLFFSHTIKAQPYNRKMLQEILKKKIRLIDYECLTYPDDGRILGFGNWAGVVGAYNALLTWGKKYHAFDLKPAYSLAHYEDLKVELDSIKPNLPMLKIVITGNGRVANGALQIMEHLGIHEVDPQTYLHSSFSEIVFTHLKNHELFHRKNGSSEWDTHHFYTHHEEYDIRFEPFFQESDILINGMYWEPSMPALFTKTDTARTDFRIKVIADITCDVEGSVPITLRATYPSDPTFGWDPAKQCETKPFQKDCIDVMAVTVLPSELPADSSRDFGASIMKEVVPLLLNGDQNTILERATIAEGGQLTTKYLYLSDYVNG
ncbi:MAG: alanine dehydrogenase [Bacteroidetes bacterium]|nr:alanine dehydrogenase [Bacteroidota bacterium]